MKNSNHNGIDRSECINEELIRKYFIQEYGNDVEIVRESDRTLSVYNGDECLDTLMIVELSNCDQGNGRK